MRILITREVDWLKRCPSWQHHLVQAGIKVKQLDLVANGNAIMEEQQGFASSLNGFEKLGVPFNFGPTKHILSLQVVPKDYTS